MSSLMKSLVAMLLLAIPTQAQLTINAPSFNDPQYNPTEATLSIYVQTNCPVTITPSNVQVTVYFAAGTFAPANGYPLGFGTTPFSAPSSASNEGADLAFNPSATLPASLGGGSGQSLTFSQFDDVSQVQGGSLLGYASFSVQLLTEDPITFQNTLLGNLLQTTNPAGVSIGGGSNLNNFYASYTGGDNTCKGPSSLNGDPQFAGFQGQNFQFHGMADEVFNLVSSPSFQMNGNFKYLSTGKCDYNDTVCYTHPGTYVDQLGFVIGDVHVKAISGSHQAGLRLWMNDVEVKHAQTSINKIIFSYWNSSEETSSVEFNQKSKFTIDVPQFTIEVTNSDYFFNLEVSLKDASILRSGSKKTSLRKKFLCSSTGMKSSERLAIVEDEMSQHYPRIPIHGLIGQTWRNALICDHAWVGDASDYVTSSLFAYDSAFNYYGTQ